MRFQFFTRLTQASLFAAAGIVALDTAGPSSTKVNAAASITLDTQRTQLVGSVLDLFSGKPSLQRLAHWREDAHFEDPITTAKGRKAYAAQWYGLAAMFDSETVFHQVVINEPKLIEMDLEQRYTVKKIGTSKNMKSRVVIEVDGDGKITHLVDKWNGNELPSSMLAEWARKVNAVTVPLFVSVPKNEEEEAKWKKEEL